METSRYSDRAASARTALEGAISHPARANALPPAEIACAAEDAGVKKAHYDNTTLVVLAMLGGAFISLGGLFAIVAMSGAEGHLAYGMTRLLGGGAFSLGLILITVGGAQLFTSDCLMVMAWASRQLPFASLVRVWILVWLGNFAGALGTATIVFLSGQYRFGHGLVGATALYFATSKAGLPPLNAFFLGILCNVLVCLAAWLAYAGRTVTDKILAVLFPVAAFVAAGFEHCVANMFFVPLGLMIERWAPASFWADLAHAGAMPASAIPVGGFLQNLVLVTAGNWAGGAIFVGAVYWLAYRRYSPGSD